MNDAYQPEPGTPAVLTRAHIGRTVIYRLPNQAVLCEGEITALSPHNHYVKIGRH